MRPVTVEHVVSQYFAQMPTAGVRGDINAVGTVAYYVALYGNYQPHGHAGMDFKCPVGTPIYAMADGTVLYAGWSEDLPGTGDVRKWLLYYNFGGIITVIQHDGWISITAHQSTNDAVHVGMVVKRGQLIGKSGDTKTRTTKVAPHVHVEALVDLSYKTGGGLIYGRTDPSKFFTGGLAAQGTITPSAPEGFLMALTDEQQKDLYYILCTKEGRQERAQQDADVLLNTAVGMLDGGRPAFAELLAVSNDRLKHIKDGTDRLQPLDTDLRGEFDKLRARDAVQAATISTLAELAASNKDLDVDQIKQAVAEAIADGITLTVKAGQ